MSNLRYILRAKARFALIQALVEFEKEQGSLTPVEWLWIFQQEQNAMLEKILHSKPNDAEIGDG